MNKKEFTNIVTILSKQEISKEDFNTLMNSEFIKSIKENTPKKYSVELNTGEKIFINTP